MFVSSVVFISWGGGAFPAIGRSTDPIFQRAKTPNALMSDWNTTPLTLSYYFTHYCQQCCQNGLHKFCGINTFSSFTCKFIFVDDAKKLFCVLSICGYDFLTITFDLQTNGCYLLYIKWTCFLRLLKMEDLLHFV